jgi:hypothetical protein
MAQYDLLLTQNRAGEGIEFQEMYVNIKKGTLIVGKTNGVDQFPEALDAGTNGHVLVPDSAVASGLKWSADTAIQSTTSQTLEIHKGEANAFKLKGVAAGKAGIRNVNDNAYADLEVKDLQIAQGFAGSAETPFEASTAHGLVTKKLLDDSIAAGFGANDAMVFKGTVEVSGGSLIVTGGGNFNALTGYSAGWTYKAKTAVTKAQNPLGDFPLEVGDMIIAVADVDGTWSADNWTVIQSDLDGANVVFKTDFSQDHSILVANSADTPTVLNSTSDDDVLRRVGSGSLAFGKILNDNITDNTIALGKMAKIAKNKLIGTPDTGTTHNPTVIDIGDGLTMSDAGVLSADHSGTVTSVTATSPVESSGGATPNISLVDGTASVGIDMSHFKFIPTARILGRHTASDGSPEELESPAVNTILHNSTIPASPTAAGTLGAMASDTNFIYKCVVGGVAGTARWRRIPMAAWAV